MTSNDLQVSRIRQLRLALTHDDFVYLFRKERTLSDGEKVPDRSAAAMALRHMRLNRLKLSFAPPSLTTGTGMFDGACQKPAVNMIIDQAWPFINGHPVELGGYVKSSQKAAIEAAFVEERKKIELWQKQRLAAGLEEGGLCDYDEELDTEDGGVLLDEKATLPDAANIAVDSTSSASLVCNCQVKCSFECWTPDD